MLENNPALRDEIIARPSIHDIAALLHSSGTTGTPKGIPLKHGHVMYGVRNAAAAGYFDEGEIHMAYLPIAWRSEEHRLNSSHVAISYAVYCLIQNRSDILVDT